MAYVPVLNTIEAELRYAQGGENTENTLYFSKGGPWSPTELVDAGATLVDWWVANMKPLINTSCGLREVQITDLTSASSGAVTYTTGLPQFGAVGGGMAPNNVAPCISFHTASRGRSFRGRNYIAGISGGDVVGNNIDGDWADAVTAAYALLLVAAGDMLAEWVVVSRFSGMAGTPRRPVPRAAGVITPILNASFTDTVVDSQRGRLPNH